MKHDDDKLNMWFSLMTSILIHVAVILLVPITMTHRVDIYPVEFGEISQTFAATRQGSPTGTPAPAPRRSQDPKVQEKDSEVKEAVSITQVPAAKPVEPEKKEEPLKQTPRPVEVQEKPAEPVPPQKPEPAPQEPEPTLPKPEPAPQQEPQPVPAEPMPRADDLGRVLTGESDETIPLPEVKPEAALPESGVPQPNTSTSETGSDNQGSGDSGGSLDVEDKAEEGKGAEAEGEPGEVQEAKPEKPQGHQFGTGKSLAINWVSPRYPKGAQNIDLIGLCELEVTVDKEGKLLGAHVLQTSGSGELDEHAKMTILTRWQFKGIEWPYKIRVTVSFKGETDVDVSFGGVTVLED